MTTAVSKPKELIVAVVIYWDGYELGTADFYDEAEAKKFADESGGKCVTADQVGKLYYSVY